MHAKQLKMLRIIVVLLLILLIFFAYNFNKKVKRFDESNEYFRQPIESQKIELWMNPYQIQRRYHIDVEQVLGQKIGLFAMKNPLSEYCEGAKMDCQELMNTLNTLKNNTQKNGH